MVVGADWLAKPTMLQTHYPLDVANPRVPRGLEIRGASRSLLYAKLILETGEATELVTISPNSNLPRAPCCCIYDS